jgi:hypothetical protein
MSEAVVDLLRDPARAQAMGDAARRRVVDRHSTASMAATVAAILHSVVEAEPVR